jgi:hypothetical protein
MFMGKKLSTYYAEKGKGWCEIHLDSKNESLYIKYFDDEGRKFFVEDFPDKSMRYVEDAAENWALGIKKLEES